MPWPRIEEYTVVIGVKSLSSRKKFELRVKVRHTVRNSANFCVCLMTA